MDIRTRPRSISSVTGTKGERACPALLWLATGPTCLASLLRTGSDLFVSQCCHLHAPSYVVFTCGADLQMVNITLRVLSKPDVEQLPRIFRVGTAGRAVTCRVRG